MPNNLEKLHEEIVKCQREFEKSKSKYIELYFRKQVAQNELDHLKTIEDEYKAAIPTIKPNVEKIRNLWRSFTVQKTVMMGIQEIEKKLKTFEPLPSKENLKFKVTQQEHEITINKLIKEYEKCPYVKELNDQKSELDYLGQKNIDTELELKNTLCKINDTKNYNNQKIIEIAEFAVEINKRKLELKEKQQQLRYRELEEKKRIEELEKGKKPVKMMQLFDDLYQPMLKIPITPKSPFIMQTAVVKTPPQCRKLIKQPLLSSISPVIRSQSSFLQPSLMSTDILPISSPRPQQFPSPRPQQPQSPNDPVVITDDSVKEIEIDTDMSNTFFDLVSSQLAESPFDVTKPKIPKLSHSTEHSGPIVSLDNDFDMDINFGFNVNEETENDTFDFNF